MFYTTRTEQSNQTLWGIFLNDHSKWLIALWHLCIQSNIKALLWNDLCCFPVWHKSSVSLLSNNEYTEDVIKAQQAPCSWHAIGHISSSHDRHLRAPASDQINVRGLERPKQGETTHTLHTCVSGRVRQIERWPGAGWSTTDLHTEKQIVFVRPLCWWMLLKLQAVAEVVFF